MPLAPVGAGRREECPQGLFGAFAQAAVVTDLILVDTQLPVLDGYDATRQINAGPNLKETPTNSVSSLVMKSSVAFAANPDSWCALQATDSNGTHPNPVGAGYPDRHHRLMRRLPIKSRFPNGTPLVRRMS
jgi:hypothetical protein